MLLSGLLRSGGQRRHHADGRSDKVSAAKRGGGGVQAHVPAPAHEHPRSFQCCTGRPSDDDLRWSEYPDLLAHQDEQHYSE